MNMRLWAAGLVGLLFGVGLSLGGMTRPAVVLGFLDVLGAWDPRLLMVMIGAVPTTAIGFLILRRRRKPWLAERFQWPTSKSLDVRLCTGAALFGAGWGLAGYCPGPALASLSGARLSVVLLVACMGFGWWLAPRLWPARARTGDKQ